MAGAERLPRAIDGRQQLARSLGAIPRRGRGRAVVAIAAGFLTRLAEVFEQRSTATFRRLAPAEQGIELGALAALVLLVGLRGGDELRELHHVLQAVHHPRVGGLAVAAGAARLLVVGLDALRQIEVRHEPDVGLVDTHAERDRRDDDQRVLHEETPLILRARRGGQARVIRQRGKPLLHEPFGDALRLVARQAVDDAGLAAAMRRNSSNCRRASVFALTA